MTPATLKSVVLLAAAAVVFPASAQPVEDQRRQVRQVIVYGNDPCPRGLGDEIVVCARRPETERYRLPEQVRLPDPADGTSALQRDQEIREMTGTGTDSCSAVGPGGQTGCLQQRINRSRVGMDGEDAREEPNP